MPDPFDSVLDDCIDRIILRQETVEQCLVRYPDYAAVLETALMAVVRIKDSVFHPSPAAKERGRRRLQQEMASLRAEAAQAVAVPFDRVLDECIDRVLLGQETVAQCLARYPNHAPELETALTAMVRVKESVFLPSAAAKERGRRRLQDEMASLQRTEALQAMGVPFDKALDQCIDRVLLGQETVAQCLARYPGHAPELETALTAMVRVKESIFLPSAAAKERGRRRLQDEMASLEREEAAKSRKGWAGWLLARPRWQTASVAIALLAVVGLPSIVAASGGAVPGQTLYPVKKGFERTRLAIQFSEEGKAKLHVNFAQRRVSEIAQLLEAGNTKPVVPALDNLDSHLASAVDIVSGLGDSTGAKALRTALQSQAGVSLGTLGQAIQAAPPAVRAEANRTYRSAGDSYAGAVEAVAVAPSAAASQGSSGSLVLSIQGTPAQGLEGAALTIQDIELYRPAGRGGTWVSLAQGPRTIDLTTLTGDGSILLEASAPPGTYTRIRFSVVAAVVSEGGAQRQVELPKEPVLVQRPFVIAKDGTTSVALDVSGQATVHKEQDAGFKVSPAPVLFVRDEKGGSTAGAGGGGQNEMRATPTARPAPSLSVPGALPTARPTSPWPPTATNPAPSPVAVGAVSSTPSPSPVPTAVPPTPLIPSVIFPTAPLPSVQVPTVLMPPTSTSPRPTPVPPPSPTTALPAPTPAPGTPTQALVQFEGTIEEIGLSLWRIGSRTVAVGPRTKVDIGAVLGAHVRVEGVLTEGMVVSATRIEVLGPPRAPPPSPTPILPPPVVPTTALFTPVPPATPPPPTATAAPLPVPTAVPTPVPAVTPTALPTLAPTVVATLVPTPLPTAIPTPLPTVALPAVATALPSLEKAPTHPEGPGAGPASGSGDSRLAPCGNRSCLPRFPTTI